MGYSQQESDSKLQFYPTDKIETYRILGVLSSWMDIVKGGNYKEFDELYLDKIKKWHFDKNELNHENIRFSNNQLEYLLTNNRLDLIDKYFNFHLKNNLVVADLFAGEGEWLKLFKILTRDNIKLIGNELEENRYNTMIKDDLIDYHYNLPFEELELPKRIIDIMLYNPPYGVTNGERNVRRYLKMILERELIKKNGILVAVIKTSDAENISDLLAQYFDYNVLAYKTNDEEYDKFGQIVIIARLLEKPLNLNNINELTKFKEYKKGIQILVNMELPFDVKDYFKSSYYKLAEIDIKKAFEDFTYTINNKQKISKMDKAWRWIIENTIVNDLSDEVITIPKPLKSGELANIIASGKINGELSLEGNKGYHVAVGGVKQVTSENKIKIKNGKGETETKLETTIQNLPYLNILINNEGKLEIKELKVGSTKQDESEE